MDIFKTLEQEARAQCVYDNSVGFTPSALDWRNYPDGFCIGNCVSLSLWYQESAFKLGQSCGVFSTSLLPAGMGYSAHVINVGWLEAKKPWIVDLTDNVTSPNESRINLQVGDIVVSYGLGTFEYIQREIQAGKNSWQELQERFDKKRKRCLLYPIVNRPQQPSPNRLIVTPNNFVLIAENKVFMDETFINGVDDYFFAQAHEEMFKILRAEKTGLPENYEEIYSQNIQDFLERSSLYKVPPF